MKMPLMLAGLALLLAGTAAQARDPLRHGRALVKEFCGACHAVGRHDKSPKKAAPPLRVIGRSFDIDDFDRRLERGISSSHPEMPVFKAKGANARAMRDYLRAIQR